MNKDKNSVVEDNIVYCEYVLQYAVTGGLPQYEGLPPPTAKKHLQQATDNYISWLPTRVCLTAVA